MKPLPSLIRFDANSSIFTRALRACGPAKCTLFFFISKQLQFIFHLISSFPLQATLYMAFALKNTASPPCTYPFFHPLYVPNAACARCAWQALPWHRGGGLHSGAASVISPWTQAFSFCWKKNIWAISREEAHSVMQVYIKQLLYQRSWKNNFFKHHCIISPLFLKNKSSNISAIKKWTVY